MATYYYWTGSGVTARANSTAYSTGARIVPAQADTAGNAAVAKRWVWECTTGGTSGAAVPTWPATVTADTTTVTDGTVTWTARTPGYSSGTTVDWTFATIYLAYGLLAAGTANDVLLVQYTSTETVTAATTFSFPEISVVSVDKDNNNTPTAMGAANWIGNSTTAYSISLNGGKVYLYGITFRIASQAANANLTIGSGDGTSIELENCYLWHDGNGASGVYQFGNYGVNNNSAYVRLVNCTLRSARSSMSYQINCMCDMEGVIYSNAGTAVSPLFVFTQNSDTGGASLTAVGCNFSFCTGTLMGVATGLPGEARFIQCKLGANVTIRAASTTNKSNGRVWVFDCSSGDTHGLFGYYDAYGSCVSDTGIYYTTGAAAQSWKIVTTANCSYYTPFVSPFVDLYNTGTTSITPYFEILRDGSTTAYQNNQIWGEFFVKKDASSTQSTPYGDRMALLGTAANQAAGAGTGSWTGKGASAWSGKVDSGSAVTPAENGHIRGRVVVGEPSITVYVDPEIRA